MPRKLNFNRHIHESIGLLYLPAKASMTAAIQQAEKNTSGEIRIHIENHTSMDVLDRAAQVFAELKMHKTLLRNGILIYIALQDHRLASWEMPASIAKYRKLLERHQKPNGRTIQNRTNLRRHL